MYRTNPKLSGDLVFQAIDWVSNDVIEEDENDIVEENAIPKKKERKFLIKVYGCTKEGNSVCVNIKGFEPYFFVKISDSWTNQHVSKFIASLKKEIDKDRTVSNKSIKDTLISAMIMNRKDFEGFSDNKQFKFIKLTFKNYSGFCTYRRILEKDIYHDNTRQKFDLYESNMLPYIRFLHHQNIIPAGWVSIPKGKYHTVDEKQSRCQIEVYSKHTDVSSLVSTNSAPFFIASFDIECTSKDGSFPQEKRREDHVIQIGTTVHKYGTKECFLHYIGTLKKTENIDKSEVNAKELVVEYFDTEKDLILGWARFIKRLDPDVLTGYNIWGFDMKYLYTRTKLGNGGDVMPYHELFLQTLNRNITIPAKYEEKPLSSSALGDNMLKIINIEGVVGIDLLKVVQRDYKLASYKLDDVAYEFMRENKLDLPPRKIFENFHNGSPDKIKEIAVYCLMDCELVNRLVLKLETLANNIGMANVCIVPLSFLFLRGQGIKIFSLVSKQCREDGFLIKVVNKKEKDDTSYEGAIVFTPKPDIYMDPIGVDDFGSLYPSSMISENISHDSLVWVKEYDLNGKLVADSGNVEYDNLPNYNYNDITYDTFQETKELDKHGKKKKKSTKIKCGYITCRYAELKSGEKNVLPRILQKLLQARKDTRKKIEMRRITYSRNGEIKEFYGFAEKNSDDDYPISKTDIIRKDEIIKVVDDYNDFEKKVLDGLQLAYKVTANSLYGQVGASTSPICCKPLAASTTSVGRRMVCFARDTVLEQYPGSKLAYGDSVSADTPILCRLSDNIFYRTIDNLPLESDVEYVSNEGKMYYIPKKGLEVWSDKGFTLIKSIMKHKLHHTKKMFRIITNTGSVDATSDHSLLLEDGTVIKPTDLKIGTKLLHHDLPLIDVDKLAIDSINIDKKTKLYSAICDYIKSSQHSYTSDDKNEVIHIIELPKQNEYVYDLETENHHFSAGIGRLVVHNTDSIFVNYMGYIYSKHGTDLTEFQKLEYTAKYCAEGAAYITSKLKRPQTLNFEKILYPFIIFAKKRYVGNKYENSITKFKQINMGVVLKRRDNANIVKEIFGNIMNTILNERNIEKAKEYYKDAIVNLLDGNVDISKLVITKSLKGDYANPTQIAHKVLAERMGERDPGNKPLSCDRLPYCYIDVKNLKCLKCNDKINPDNCKCVRCMKLFCGKHLGGHKDMCKVICRFCRTPDGITECPICKGWYCLNDMIKHHGRCTNKCEPVRNKCSVCDSTGAKEKCSICSCYICAKDMQKHVDAHKKCRDCNKIDELKECESCRITFCPTHLIKHPNKCKKPVPTKLLQGDLIEHPQFIKDNGYKIDYRYYLDHQIEVPTMQIFALIMKHPESLIAAAVRRDNNRKAGNIELTRWFQVINVNKEIEEPKDESKNFLDDEQIEDNFIEIDDDIDIIDEL